MIVVCDTNVLISAFLFPGGNPDKILHAILSGRFQHATSPDIISELKGVLKGKFRLTEAQIEGVSGAIIDSSLLCYPTERLSVVQADPDDNRVLECATTAKADVIVTGDKKHLLPLGRFRRTVILSPAGFVERFGVV